MILILDYGVGNLGSILNMLDYIEVEASIGFSADKIERASHIILPGVGAFEHAIKKFNRYEEKNKLALNKAIYESNKPLLGICLGMQMLGSSSEESIGSEGLNLISGASSLIQPPPNSNLKCPHMGWTKIEFDDGCPLFKDFPQNARFYFAHSYKFCPSNTSVTTSVFEYGKKITASVQSENIFGVQFHPEKSHRFGMQLLKNFSRIN